MSDLTKVERRGRASVERARARCEGEERRWRLWETVESEGCTK
jgi:hypothetical protein